MIGIATDRPLQEAVEQIANRMPVGSAMTSREWELELVEIRLRSLFSATVEDERILAEMKVRLQARIELAKRDGRTMDRGVFIDEMRQIIKDSGYKRGEDVKRGSLQDLKSTRRLGLIWDMNLAQAQGYARWKADMTEDGLDNEPCYELIRVMNRMEIRDWPRIWQEHGGQFFDGLGSNDDYPSAPGRMIALKTDPIWTRISRFGVPWPPFDWGSGMGLRGIDRDEADAFGITGPEDVFQPLELPFNESARASVKDVPEHGRARILEKLAGDVEIVEDEVRILPAPVNVPTVPLFSRPVNDALKVAAQTLAGWPENRLLGLLDALEKTVAWPRYRAALRAAGAEPRNHEALIRAMAQFLATPDAREAILAVRMTASRDAFWSPADFHAVESFIRKGGAS